VRRPGGVGLEHRGRLDVEDPPDVGPEADQGFLVDGRRPQFRPSVEVPIVGIDVEQALELAIRLHLDTGRVAHPEHDRHAIGLLVVHRCQHAFARRHAHVRLMGRRLERI